MTLVGRTVLHYEVTAELGAGAVGHVYLGRDTRTGRRVALKFIQSPSVFADASLEREARAAARLSHPGIVALFGLEHEADLRFLVEENVDGETLLQRFARGPLGRRESLRLARELAGALEHAHSHGVLHRDLKPENILIAGDGTYKIADFGIAKVEGSTPTGTGALLGTMPYMAPERMRGNRGDARSDLFSLGAILYEALTGRRAFPAQTEAEAVYSVMNEEPAPIAGAGPHHELMTRLVTRLLAKEAHDRPASAGLVRDLLAEIEALGVRSRPPARRVARVVGMITLLGIAAWLVWWRPWTWGTPSEVVLTIAVLPFENLVDAEDREHLGPVIGSLLVTDLAQLGELSVLGTERLFEILHQSGDLEGGANRRTAGGIMRRARVGSIVSGKILQTDPAILLIAEVSAAASGHVLQAARVQGEPGQTVFDVVDSLSARLIPRMRAMQGITATRSWPPRQNVGLGAYRDYVEGLESLVRGDARLAEEKFLASVHQDPGFAPARTQLEYVRWLRTAPMARESP